LSTSQANPSSSPSWVFAEHAVIVHVLVFICSIFNCSKIYLNSNLPHPAAKPVPNLACSQRSTMELLTVTFPSLFNKIPPTVFQVIHLLL
jgi:hypothetical protein